MARAGTRPGLIPGILVYLLLTASGCQKDDIRPAAVEPPAPEATAVWDGEAAASPPAEVSEANAPVELTLKFTSEQTAAYRATTEAYKSVEWQGPTVGRPAGFVDGRTGTHVEVTFEQQVREVRADGNAVVRITIKGVKYASERVSKVVLEFDSANPQNASSSLVALIGRGYAVVLSPRGEVLAVEDVEAARQGLPEGPTQAIALRLFTEEQIRSRHEIPPLMALKESRVPPGSTWSDVRTLSFGDMGAKAYERVYTLMPRDDGPALVEMKALLSSSAGREMHGQQSASLSGMFDNVEDYTGRLELDLDSGQVRLYDEQMRVEWVVVDPSTAQESRPVALRMAATRLHRVERVQ